MKFPHMNYADLVTSDVSVSLSSYADILLWITGTDYVNQFEDHALHKEYAEMVNQLAVTVKPHQWDARLTAAECRDIESFKPDRVMASLRSFIMGIIEIISRLRFCPVAA